MKLVSDWKDCWRWVSMNCMLIAASIQGAWVYIPDGLRAAMPPQVITITTIGLLILGIIGRLFKQSPKPVKKKKGK